MSLDTFCVLRHAAWDMYASAALSMSLHPGTTRDKAVQRSIDEVALIADQLLAERDKRFLYIKDIDEAGDRH